MSVLSSMSTSKTFGVDMDGTQSNSQLNQPDILIQLMEEKEQNLVNQTLDKQSSSNIANVVSIVDLIRFNQQILQHFDA